MISDLMTQASELDPDTREAMAKVLISRVLPIIHEMVDQLPDLLGALARMDESSQDAVAGLAGNVLTNPQAAEAISEVLTHLIKLDMAMSKSPEIQEGVTVVTAALGSAAHGLKLIQGGLGHVAFTSEDEVEARERVDKLFEE
jgi:hypothetical protein